MKFTLSWLKDHLETDKDLDTIIDTLTIGVAQKKGDDLRDHLKRLQTGLKSLRCNH